MTKSFRRYLTEGAYSITLTPDEYRSAQVMSSRGYLGELVHHAQSIEETDNGVILHYSEADAWEVLNTMEADPDAVWALTTPATTLGRKFQKFIDAIV
jgi:hypothetical protein